jgi:hypothetical protein
MPVIPATWDTKIDVQDHLRQKVSEIPPTPSQQKKLGMVAHVCAPNYTGSISKRTAVQTGSDKKCKTYLTNN